MKMSLLDKKRSAVLGAKVAQVLPIYISMEISGLEPLTSSLPAKRSPN